MFVCRGWLSVEIRKAEYLLIWIVLLEGIVSGAVVSHTPKQVPNTEGLQQVTVGESALLPCLLPHPPSSLDAIRVYWQTANTYQVVHIFNKGQEEFEHQAPAYRNRTRLFTSQLQSGNFSVELHNVSEHDNLTTFQCLAMYDGSRGPEYQGYATLLVLKEDALGTTHDLKRGKTLKETTLHTRKRDDANPSHEGGKVAGNAVKVPVALLVLISLVLAVLRPRLHKCCDSSPEKRKAQRGATERDQQQEPLVSDGQT
ncbi:uncharacterized protein LOC134077923 [Sardina pilchardus]|uniref:uncharacterized protein LOC134077923 n=1 Tax=Sardina pilchardus TaxID=27697 RepID=UPI002E1668B5